MLYAFCFCIALIAAILGSITGIGGGVLIKPALDATGLLNVSAVSFLSGLAVLAMAIISLLRGKKGELEPGRSTFLALGAALGGVVGKLLFDLLRGALGAPDTIGAVQAALLIVIIVFVVWYVLNKAKIRSLNVTSPAACFALGLLLGLVSAFLGIGGGPLNLGVLYLFLSMDTKKAAQNSLYVILFSQIASLLFTLVRGTVPVFDPWTLALLVGGSLTGGFIGAGITKKLSAAQTERVFIVAMILIVFINIYNIVRFVG